MAALLAAGAALLLVPGALTSYLAFAVVGLAGGVFAIASGVVWARTYGVAQLGRLQGIGFSVQIAGAAVGPLVLAVSGAVTGSYVPGLAVMSSYTLLALAAALRWRDPRNC